MPLKIDHDARRRQLAEIAADLIAEGGAEAATVRAVAAAAGFSTKAVSHYFPDKRALMLMTYRHATLRSGRITEASGSAAAGDVLSLLETLLPANPESARNWKVWFAFWGLAFADPELAREQQLRAREFEARIEAMLASDPGHADLPGAARTALAGRLFSTLVGVAMQAVFDPGQWPAERQSAMLRDTLRSCGGGSAPGPALAL